MTVLYPMVRDALTERAVAEAKAVDEVKEIINVSAAMAAYARQAKNRQMEADAFEIRLRAERRIGEMLEAGKEERAPVGRPKEIGEGDTLLGPPPTIREIVGDGDKDRGKHRAARARKIGRLTDDEFEKVVRKGRDEIETIIEKSIKKIRGTQGTGLTS